MRTKPSPTQTVLRRHCTECLGSLLNVRQHKDPHAYVSSLGKWSSEQLLCSWLWKQTLRLGAVLKTSQRVFNSLHFNHNAFLSSTFSREVTLPCYMFIQHLTQCNRYLYWHLLTFNRACCSPKRPNFFRSHTTTCGRTLTLAAAFSSSRLRWSLTKLNLFQPGSYSTFTCFDHIHRNNCGRGAAPCSGQLEGSIQPVVFNRSLPTGLLSRPVQICPWLALTSGIQHSFSTLLMKFLSLVSLNNCILKKREKDALQHMQGIKIKKLPEKNSHEKDHSSLHAQKALHVSKLESTKPIQGTRPGTKQKDFLRHLSALPGKAAW